MVSIREWLYRLMINSWLLQAGWLLLPGVGGIPWFQRWWTISCFTKYDDMKAAYLFTGIDSLRDALPSIVAKPSTSNMLWMGWQGVSSWVSLKSCLPFAGLAMGKAQRSGLRIRQGPQMDGEETTWAWYGSQTRYEGDYFRGCLKVHKFGNNNMKRPVSANSTRIPKDKTGSTAKSQISIGHMSFSKAFTRAWELS